MITESDFQHEMVRFLRGAADRNGGRKERENANIKKKARKGGPSKKSMPSRIVSSSDSDN
jgi:hypothetical protein